MLSKEEFDKLTPEQQTALLQKMQEIQDLTKVVSKPDVNLPQLSMKDMESKIREVIADQIKTMTPVDRKYFVFPGIGKVDLDNITPEGKFHKTCKFLKAIVGRDVQVLNTMHEETRVKANLSEGTTTAGGFLVPEEFKAEILRLAAAYGVLRRECRMIPMMYDVIRIPAAGSTDQSAHWIDEASQITQTNPNFREVSLTIKKLGAIPKVTNELLQDANVPVVQYLTELIGEAFAKAEDEQGFNGIGSPFVGALNATGAPSRAIAAGTTLLTMSYPDLINATGDIYTNALQNAKFYFHRSVGARIRGLITSAGAPIFGATANEIAGFPIILTEVLPAYSGVSGASTSWGVFGDIRKGIAIGERGSVTMKISEEATVDSDNLFEKDMAALRMIERVCIGVLLPSAFVKLTTAAS